MAYGFKLNLCSLNTRGLRNKTIDNLSSLDSNLGEYGKIFHSLSKSSHGRGVAVRVEK